MEKVSDSLGLAGVFLYTPTALVIGIRDSSGERTYVRRVDSEDVDISKILQLDGALEELEDGAIDIGQAAERLEAIADSPPTYSNAVSAMAAFLACASVAAIFGGSLLELAVAGVFGCVIALFSMYAARFAQRGLMEPLLGFSVAAAAMGLSYLIPVNDRLVTLAALILPIPGLALTVALTELAVGHLSSGSARLAGAIIRLFTLVVGVGIAWRLAVAVGYVGMPVAEPLPSWSLWLAVCLAPIAFAIIFKAPLSQWPAIILVVVLAFTTSYFVGSWAGIEMGAFTGALVVGCGSNAYARIRNRPAMITQTPGLLILVPGSVGYSSLTALIEDDTIRGIDLAFSMLMLGVSLVGGLLLANQLISPKRIL